jgi:hypothetical protein
VVRGSCRNDLRARSLHVVTVRPAQRSAPVSRTHLARSCDISDTSAVQDSGHGRSRGAVTGLWTSTG